MRLPAINSLRRAYRQTVACLSAILFDAAAENHTSPVLSCAQFSEGLLVIDVGVTGAPTDIYIELYFSDDGSTFYKYVSGPFGDLRYEDAAGDKEECFKFPVLAPYCKVKAVSAGCSSGNTFLLTAKIIFNQ